MKYSIIATSKFKKDLKTIIKRGYNVSLLEEIVDKYLMVGKKLPKKYKDHKLQGDYENNRECHITPDWLLVYKYYESNLILQLTRTDTHSDLFDRY